MNKETAGKIRMIAQWVLVALCVLCAFGWMPTFSSVLFLLAALILLPIKKIEEVFEKIKIKFVIRIVAAFIIFIIACCITPEEAPSTAAKKEAAADVKAQIIDTWHYGDDRAIDFYYTFNEDGTFHLTSDGGTYDEGTYEIVEGKTIKTTGQFYNNTFTIKNADRIVDEKGEALKRFVREDYYDDDDDE